VTKVIPIVCPFIVLLWWPIIVEQNIKNCQNNKKIQKPYHLTEIEISVRNQYIMVLTTFVVRFANLPTIFFPLEVGRVVVIFVVPLYYGRICTGRTGCIQVAGIVQRLSLLVGFSSYKC